MSAWASIIQAGVGILGNVAAGIQGARIGKEQMKLGRQMTEEGKALSEQYQRPELQTPEAIKLQMEMSQGRQFQNLPGMEVMQNQINQATAGGVTAMEKMGTGAESFGGVANLYKNQMQGQQNLGVQNAQFQDQGQQSYMKDLQGLGDYQQQQWEWNQADPYLQAQEKAAYLEQAGRQGEWEGLKMKMGSWAETFSGIANSVGGGSADGVLSMIK